MITRVEIDGFRNFIDFSVDLYPLQVIAGPNSSGKSNFFDLLLLLSRLAGNDNLSIAFSGIRGDPIQQFTTSKPGTFLKTIRIAVEAIVPKRIRDPWGETADLKNTHLRYSLQLNVDKGTHGSPLINISDEKLTTLRKKESLSKLVHFKTTNIFKKYLIWGKRSPDCISTERNKGKVVLHQDSRSGRKREYHLKDLQGTVLSAANTATFPHAFAMRQELSKINQLQLEPEALRKPSKIGIFKDSQEQRFGIHGSNMPAVVARIKEKDPKLLALISSDLRSVVKDAKSVDVYKDEIHDQYIAQVLFTHGGPFPASLLSDGTLRILSLSTMKHDDQNEGVLCFEEPENGIHPECMRGLLRILKGLALDEDESTTKTRHYSNLRQVLVNTHSPSLVSIVEQKNLLFAETSRYYSEKLNDTVLVGRFLHVRDELPLRSPREQRQFITRNEVIDFLSTVKKENWIEDKQHEE